MGESDRENGDGECECIGDGVCVLMGCVYNVGEIVIIGKQKISISVK